MKRLLFFALIASLLITGCGSYRSLSGVAPSMPAEQDQYAGPMLEEAPSEPSTGNAGQAAAVERMVIENAELSIVVADVNARMQAVQALATKLGGYVVSSNKYQTYVNNGAEALEAQVVLRVPSETLDEALEQIKADVVEVQTESRTGQDVTAEYVDLQSRLKNLEATEAQLVKIMESATETEDVMSVFNQLTSIREQIELVKGQMKYYEDSAAMSSISVRIIAEETLQPIEIAGWKPGGVARDAIQDLVYFFQDFVDFLIYFVISILPRLVLIALPLYLIFLVLRALVRWLRKSKPAPQKPEQPAGK